MIKETIIKKRNEHFDQLCAWLDDHPIEKWDIGPDNKWTTGQHVPHLVQSEKALSNGLKIPGFIAKYKWGKANRATRSYDEITIRYQNKLRSVNNVVSPLSKNMPILSQEEKPKIIKKLTSYHELINSKIYKMKAAKLDTQLLPHPLMGRMILAAILLWSACHTDHHLQILRAKY
jgi:hypothetical protein